VECDTPSLANHQTSECKLNPKQTTKLLKEFWRVHFCYPIQLFFTGAASPEKPPIYIQLTDFFKPLTEKSFNREQTVKTKKGS